MSVGSRVRLSLLTVGMMLFWNVSVSADTTPGELDPTFGADGFAFTAIAPDPLYPDDLPYGVTFQADGKIVVAGCVQRGRDYNWPERRKIAVVRYRTDGTLDTAFGSDGVVTTVIRSHNNGAYSLAIQEDGKILTGGYADYTLWGYDWSLVRYLPGGALDPSFGSGGIVRTEWAPSYPYWVSSYLNALIVQPDGKIVGAGNMRDIDRNRKFAVARYLNDGRLDNSFGVGGKVTTDFGGGDGGEAARDVALQPDGKIVVAGVMWNGTDSDFALIRYDADGSLDPAFGVGGTVTTPIGPEHDGATSVEIQGDGKIVVAGFSFSGSYRNFVALRYEEDGSLDTGFGSDGIVTVDFGDDSVPTSLAIDTYGRLVMAGNTWNGSDWNLAVARLDPDGVLDDRFGDGGLSRLDAGYRTDDVSRAMKIDAGGQIVVAGECEVPGNGLDFCIARVNGGPHLPPFIEFAQMGLAMVVVEYHADPEIGDRHVLGGSFVLAEESDGVDLTEEAVFVDLDAWQLEIPGGWLEACEPFYRGEGIIAGVAVRATFADEGNGTYHFRIDVEGADLEGTRNPALCGLTIGNDGGFESVRLDGILRRGGQIIVE